MVIFVFRFLHLFRHRTFSNGTRMTAYFLFPRPKKFEQEERRRIRIYWQDRKRAGKRRAFPCPSSRTVLVMAGDRTSDFCKVSAIVVQPTAGRAVHEA